MEKASAEEYRELIDKGEFNDPLVFLDALISGRDPRQLSKIYELVTEIEEFSGGDPPSKEDWCEIVDLVKSVYKYKEVPLAASQKAASDAAQYLHPKRKQVEVLGDDTKFDLESNPLTEDEIKLFKEKFNANY